MTATFLTRAHSSRSLTLAATDSPPQTTPGFRRAWAQAPQQEDRRSPETSSSTCPRAAALWNWTTPADRDCRAGRQPTNPTHSRRLQTHCFAAMTRVRSCQKSDVALTSTFSQARSALGDDKPGWPLAGSCPEAFATLAASGSGRTPEPFPALDRASPRGRPRGARHTLVRGSSVHRSGGYGDHLERQYKPDGEYGHRLDLLGRRARHSNRIAVSHRGFIGSSHRRVSSSTGSSGSASMTASSKWNQPWCRPKRMPPRTSSTVVPRRSASCRIVAVSRPGAQPTSCRISISVYMWAC